MANDFFFNENIFRNHVSIEIAITAFAAFNNLLEIPWWILCASEVCLVICADLPIINFLFRCSFPFDVAPDGSRSEKKGGRNCEIRYTYAAQARSRIKSENQHGVIHSIFKTIKCSWTATGASVVGGDPHKTCRSEPFFLYSEDGFPILR